MAEWSNAPHSKCGVPARVPRVRIPASPPRSILTACNCGLILTDYYSSPLNDQLRDPPGGLARSAYAIEINPWSRRGDVEAALLFRGTIVSAYGYIETQLGNLAIRCSRLPVYEQIRETFPFSMQARLSFLKTAFSTGPLKPHAGLALQFFARVEVGLELRHLAAHAQMQVLPRWGINFDDIPSASPVEVTSRYRHLTMQELELEAWRAARLSRLGQHLLGLLDSMKILPPA